MRTLSEKFKELQEAHPGQILRFVDLTLKDGTVLHLTNHELWNKGFQFEDAVSGESEFEIGSVIVNQCVISINNIYDDFTEYNFDGAEAVCYLGMQISETQLEKIRICTMTVVEAPYQNSSVITLTCYDNASRFDRDYSESTLKYPATRSQIIRDDAGQDWLLYHGFSRSTPENGRILLLDQIKWDQEGWPYVEGGSPSYETQKAPVFNN